MQDIPEPGPELDQKRPVEAETLAYPFDIGGAGLIACDHRGGITRRDVKQTEAEQRGEGRENTPEDIRDHICLLRRHAVFETPQKNGSGPLAMPETFLRHAV